MEEEKKDEPEFVPEWDVSRDGEGNPVTITVEQMYAIWHALRVVDLVRLSESYRLITQDGELATTRTHWQTEVMKSRLLGRMLIDGKPPTKTKPPMSMGGPSWRELPGGDPF